MPASEENKKVPSGKTHDALTFLLAAPVAAVAYAVTADVVFAVISTAAFLFGGLMFGPDRFGDARPFRAVTGARRFCRNVARCGQPYGN
jgi:hypothetical protein